MRTRTVTVTPKMAFEWLKKNKRNRPLKKTRVERYASEMKQGRWKETGEAIKFTEDGDLIDGQHRLSACCLSQAPFVTLIAEGIKPEAFDWMDQGGIRTLGDCFGRENKKNYNSLAAAVRIIANLELGRSAYYGPRLSPADGFVVLGRWPRLERNLQEVFKSRQKSCPLEASVVSAYVTFLEVRHGKKCHQFWVPFYTGAEMVHRSPAHMLHNALCLASRDHTDVTRVGRHQMCAKAYNAFITGKSLRSLKLTDADGVEFVS